MELNLSGKTVLITGGSKGIGYETARRFGKEGCRVAICARNRRELLEAEEQLKKEGIEVFSKSLDVSKKEELEQFAKETVGRWGYIHVWINNAGIASHRAMMDTSDEEWERVLAVNLSAVYYGCKIAASYMKKDGGIILNAGSFQTFFPAAGSGPYGATKAAVASLTRTFAAELACYKIRVITYIPGVIETPMGNLDNWIADTGQIKNIPMRRTGVPADIANTLVFLASDAASYINGVSIEITGGKFCVQNPMYSWEK